MEHFHYAFNRQTMDLYWKLSKMRLYYLKSQRLRSFSRASKTKTKITNLDFRTNLITDDAQFIVNEVDE